MMVLIAAMCVCMVCCLCALPSPAWAVTTIDPAQIDPSVVSYLQSNRQDIGVSMVVSQKGEVLSAQHYGLADRETGAPITQDTVFRWGDASQLLAWVSVLQLAEAKQISLDTDVREYLPADMNVVWPEETVVTLNQLISGTAGIDAHPELAYLPGDRARGAGREAGTPLDVVAPYRQAYPPGSVVNNSGYAAYICAAVVEHVTHMPYVRYVERHIFIPLNMSHTCFDIDPTHPYMIDGGVYDAPEDGDDYQLSRHEIDRIESLQQQQEQLQHYTRQDIWVDTAGKHSTIPAATGVMGTTLDMARFARALTGGANESLFNTTTARNDFWHTNFTYRNAAIGRIASGLYRVPGAARLWTISSHAPGATCVWYFSPDDNISMVIAANSPDAQFICDDISSFIFGSPMSGPTDTPEPSDKWTGAYQLSSTPTRGITRITSLLHRLYVYGEDGSLMVNNRRYVQLEPGTYLDPTDTSLQATLRFANHPNFTLVASFANEDAYRIPNDLLMLELFLAILMVAGVLYSLLATVVVPVRAGILLGIRRHTLRMMRAQSASSNQAAVTGVLRGATRSERMAFIKHYGLSKPISIDEINHEVTQRNQMGSVRRHHIEVLAYITCVLVVVVAILIAITVYAIELSWWSAHTLLLMRYIFIATACILILCSVVLTLRTWNVIHRRIKETERLGNLAAHGFKHALTDKERAHLRRLLKLALVRAFSAGSALALVINMLYWQLVS